jgi:thioredoxin reductase (NADPH)
MLPVAALFVFIGQQPRTDWLPAEVERDEAGFVATGPAVLHDGKRPAGWGLDREPFLLESSVPGVFAAGDVRARSVKRIASAVGEGAMAIQFVHQYRATL